MPRLEAVPEERLLAEAAQRSAKYEWTAAADLYQKALDQQDTGRESLQTARISDLLARSQFKAAFQAATREEFKKQMQLAKESSEKVIALYEGAGSKALADRSRARSLFASYWSIEDAAERRKLLERSISLAQQASAGLGSQRDRGDLAQTHLDLLSYSSELCDATIDSKVVKEQFERIAPIADNLVNEYDGLGKDEDLAQCLNLILYMTEYYFVLVEPSNRDVFAKFEECARLTLAISEKAGTPLAVSFAKRAAGVIAAYVEDRPTNPAHLWRAAAEAAEPTKDSYYIGFLLAGAAGWAYSAASITQDSDQKRELLEEGIKFAQLAVKKLEIAPPSGPLDFAYENWGECHFWLAYHVETDLESKKEQYRRTIEIAQKGIDYTTPSTPWTGTGHELSKAMVFLANMETDPREKSRLLGEALRIREKVVLTVKALAPKSWNLGVQYNYLALIKAELSRLSLDARKQVEQLREAVSDMERCVELCTKAGAPADLHFLGQFYEWYGDILAQLFKLTGESDSAHRAIEVYEDTVTKLSRWELTGRIAAVRWKVARIYDSTGNYKQASQAFLEASEDYRLSAKKSSSLSFAHEELASYMEAWSQIEEARLHHDQEHYPLAAEKYFNAAGLLQHTRTWDHLSTHYVACSLLEKGEALSRQESPDASVEAFSNALEKFQDTKKLLEEKEKERPESLEKQELKDWLEITKGREKYSRARIELEEARLLDKTGEEEASSAKYRSAHQAFKRLLSDATNDQSRREIETLTLFCDAWANMKQAEVEASPELYSEAASSFTKAKESTTRTKFRLLALANASMCKALEAGTRFRHSRDIQLYGEIKKQLETAADQYEQAGFKNAADWTQATQAMFDALAYMASAEVELEPRKKTEFYHLAEKHLELASKLYREAGFQTKSDEALRHLKRARQEKEILLTPAEVLAENPAVAGAVVAPVSLIRDHAAGLEKYEDAQVVGNLTLRESELGVGSDLTVELEMANVGKSTAMLIKLENLAPAGLQLDKQKISQRVGDNFIDMKGKRLEYLKTHEVKVPMRALAKGIFQIRPRVLFVDEKGTYKSYDFEPVALTVKELGISGWLKGPGSK